MMMIIVMKQRDAKNENVMHRYKDITDFLVCENLVIVNGKTLTEMKYVDSVTIVND